MKAKLEEKYGVNLSLKCFSGDAEVALPSSAKKSIRDISVGDYIMAFDANEDGGRGSPVSKRVTKIFRNVTRVFVELRYYNGLGEEKVLNCTPGHHFLNSAGRFQTISEILQLDSGESNLVRLDGSLVAVRGRYIEYNEENASFFEEYTEEERLIDGDHARSTVIGGGWVTYNLEVEDLHTYIVGDVRVHNLSEMAEKVSSAFLSGFGLAGIVFSGYAVTAMHHVDVMLNEIPKGVTRGFAVATLGTATELTTSVVNAGASLALGVAGFIQNVARGDILGAVGALATGGLGAMSSLAGGLVMAVGALIEGAVEIGGGVIDVVSDIVSGVGDAIGGAIDAIGDAISGAIESISDFFNSDDEDEDGDSDTSSKPVLLDLDGNGFDIDTLNTSTKYIDFDNDGFETRTAWAGAGTGVLILDADGDGKISDSKEFAFTEWDPAADSDLAALKGIFDTNNNGKLDSGDARWSQFKVAVGDQLVSLASLGIASIDLTPSGSGQVFEDGSAITGTTTFTKTDGSTGLVGDATLAGETSQYVLKRSTSTSGGTVTVTTSGYEPEGRRVFRNSVATSADGLSVTRTYDDDGDGIWDRSQTDVKSVSSTGAVTRAISNFNAGGSLHDKTTTVTSADQKTITTTVDQNGDGETDQKQTVAISSNGSSTTTVWQYAIDNTVLRKVLTISSADGLTKIVKTDLDGSGTYDTIETTTTVIAGDGGRTITKETRSEDGSLVFKEGQLISADGRTKTLQYDRNGNGTYEEKITSAITVAGGNIVTTTSRLSANNTLLDSSVTTRSTNGRSTTVERDINGDGTIDLTSSDVLSVSSAGTRTRTLTEKSGDGTLLSKQTIVTSATGDSVTTTTDMNGDGERDTVHKITTDENGVTTTVDAVFNADGSYRSRVEQVTNAAGISTTTTFDLDGNGVVDLTTTDLLQSVNGSDRRRTVTTMSADGSLLDRVLTESTADGLNRTISHDVDGNGTYDRVIATENVLNTDGSRVQRVSTTSANGTLISKSTATTSADRRITATDVDTDGDGITDYKEYAQLYTDGRTRLAQAKRNADGSLRWRDETTVSADKLLTTVTHDLDGDDVIDYTDKKQTTLNADGSQTTVSSLLSNSGTVLSSEALTVSGNGLTKTTASDLNGNGVAERTMVEAIDFTSAGNTTKTVTIRGDDDSLIFKSTETTSGSGLQVTLAEDLDGSGSTDRTTISTVALAQDGSSTKTTQVKNRSGGLIAKETIVTTGDKRVVTSAVDLDGNGADDKRSATTIGYDGSLVETASTFNSSGDKTSSVFAVTSNSGLKKLILADVDGDGIDDTRRSITTVLNADGGKTTTTRLATAAGSRLEQEIFTVSADGLSISSVWSGAGGSATRSMSDVTVLNASGSTTRTVQYFKADGSLDRKTLTTLRADGTVASILEDLNGDGTNDVSTTMTKSPNGDETYLSKQISNYLDGDLSDNRKRTTVGNASKETVFFRVDGSGVETITRRISEARSFSTSGSEIYTTTYYRGTQLTGSSKVTTSGNKLSITREWDLNANSTYETKQTDVTSLANNGANTHTVSDYASGTLQAKRTTITSANGLTVNATWETFGSSATTQTSSDVTTINDSGSRTQEITYNNGSSLLSQYEITTSSDGRTKTVKQDLDGSGSYEKTIFTTTLDLADGSSYQDRKIKTAAGTLLQTETTILSADERYLTVKRDRDGDGDTDQSEKTTIFLDGRKETTLTNFKQDGVSKGSELSIDVAADGLKTVAEWDRDGDGDIEQKKTSTRKVFSDGSIETVDVYENLDQPSQPQPESIPWFFFNPNRWGRPSAQSYNAGAGGFGWEGQVLAITVLSISPAQATAVTLDRTTQQSRRSYRGMVCPSVSKTIWTASERQTGSKPSRSMPAVR